MSVLTSREPSSEYLTVAEVAHELRCSEPTIRRRIRSGDLAAVKLGAAPNSAVRVSRDAVCDWLERRATSTANER